jgi:hypothetical protein
MQNHIIFTVVWIYIFILLFAGRVLIGSNLYLRKCNSSSSSLLSDTRRSLGASRHCLGQQLFKHRYFLHDSPKNETTHQHVRRFGRKRKHRTYSSSWYHNPEANTGKFLLSSPSNFFFTRSASVQFQVLVLICKFHFTFRMLHMVHKSN